MMARKLDASNRLSSASTSNNSKTECRWMGCKNHGPYSTVDDLVSHVQQCHLSQFCDEEFVVCLWQGCKVFNTPFEKKDWLPQHMRRHTNEKPHKCFMNGCNMSFWSPQALQTHVQLHFKPSAPSKHKKSLQSKSSPSIPMFAPSLHDPLSSSSLCPNPNYSTATSNNLCHTNSTTDINGSTLMPRAATTSHMDPSRSRHLLQSAHGPTAFLPHHLQVRVPLNSNLRLIMESCSQGPIPINGSIIHNDDIDMSTHSIIRKTLLTHLLAAPPECCSTAALTDAGRNFISLTGAVIGRRTVLGDKEYLVRWSPMLVPDSWVPVSNYTGFQTLALSELKDCQKSTLVQCNFLTTGRYTFAGRKRKRL